MRIAIVGTGIAGNTAAYLLAGTHSITVYERELRPGGHSHTVDIDHTGARMAVDIGFIVYNTRNYPEFSGMLDMLGVASQPSTMSFSVRDERSGLEYSGTNLNTFFAQRRNLLNPAFLRMLRDSSGAAERLTHVLSGSRYIGELMEWIPESVACEHWQ